MPSAIFVARLQKLAMREFVIVPLLLFGDPLSGQYDHVCTGEERSTADRTMWRGVPPTLCDIYRRRARQFLLAVSRTDKITAFNGTAPKRILFIAFDSAEKAQARNNSAAQNEINVI